MITSLKRGRVFCIICKMLVFVFLFTNTTIIFGQSNKKVIALKGKIAAINVGSENGISSGQKYILKRSTSSGTIEVGVIEIIKTLNTKSSIRLIEERGSNSIKEGDFLGNEVEDSVSELFDNASQQDTKLEKESLKNQQLSQQGGNFVQGKMDGARDARGNALWIIAGVGCGILGVGAAYLTKPSPPLDQLAGKSQEYVMGYTEGYQNKAKDINTGYACAGWGSWVLIYLATYNSNK
jgi:hypothetical protein